MWRPVVSPHTNTEGVVGTCICRAHGKQDRRLSSMQDSARKRSISSGHGRCEISYVIRSKGLAILELFLQRNIYEELQLSLGSLTHIN